VRLIFEDQNRCRKGSDYCVEVKVIGGRLRYYDDAQCTQQTKERIIQYHYSCKMKKKFY